MFLKTIAGVFRFRILGLNFSSSLKLMIGICYLEILSLAVKQLMKGSYVVSLIMLLV